MLLFLCLLGHSTTLETKDALGFTLFNIYTYVQKYRDMLIKNKKKQRANRSDGGNIGVTHEQVPDRILFYDILVFSCLAKSASSRC